MLCPVCQGSGVMKLPHVPGDRGGWLDQTYDFSGMQCGACNGTGQRPEPGLATAMTRDDCESGRSSEMREPEIREPQTPNAEEQLQSGRKALLTALRYCEHLPIDITAGWRADLPLLDVYTPEESLSVLGDIRRGFDLAKDRHRPARDVFLMSVTAELGFEREMSEIERHLRFLEQLMRHAETWLKAHPEERRG